MSTSLAPAAVRHGDVPTTVSFGTIGVGVLTAIALLLTTGCERGSSDTSGGAGDALEVVATVGMIADMAGQLGGDCVEVSSLMGPGVDPHLYRPTAGDVSDLRKADVIAYGGLLLEGRMSEVLNRLRQRIRTVAVLESAPRNRLLQSATYAGAHDPHLWMDPSLWAETVGSLEAVLSDERPDCAAAVAERASAYRAELLALHEWIAASVATIPEQQRALVTAHDAFNYFGRAYDIDVIGIQGVSTEAEAGLADLGRVADLVSSRRIPAIFVESSVNPRNIEAVQAAVRSRGWDVSIGGQLFSDAMGEAGTWQGTYIGMLRSNVQTIVTRLGGTVAPWPDALAGWATRWGLST